MGSLNQDFTVYDEEKYFATTKNHDSSSWKNKIKNKYKFNQMNKNIYGQIKFLCNHFQCKCDKCHTASTQAGRTKQLLIH